MKKTRILLCILTVLTALALSVCVSAADDLVFTFENEESLNGWSLSYLRYNFEPGYFNGYATEKSANLSDPMLISPTININAEDYRYIVVNMKYSLDATWNRNGTMFFLVPGGSWSQTYSVTSDKFENLTENDFVNIVYDMSKSELWTGSISQIRFDPFEAPGSIGLKSITFTNTLPEETQPDEGDGDDEGNTEPTKEIGVFLKPYTYNNNFTDVPSNEWYASEVANAYELGLFAGKSDTQFDPYGNMTVAEAITLAARTNNNYGTADYDFSVADGEQWYEPYVEYAVNKGIISETDFSDYDALITRGQMAKIFASALPSSEYAYINSVASIPDVPQTSDYFSAVYKLYNAGIIMGNDGYGTFSPDNNITRCEAAAIINRVAIKDNRLSKNLISSVPQVNRDAFTMSSEAKFLMDDEKFRHTHLEGIPGNWDLVQIMDAPGKVGRASYNLVDNSSENEAYFVRKFFEVSDGVLDFEFGARIYGRDGAFLTFTDTAGTPVVYVLLDHGNYTVLAPDGTYTDTGIRYFSSTVHFNFHIDMDKKTFDLGIDGAYAGTYPTASNNAISQFRFGVTESGVMTVTANYAFLYHNYLMLEKFANAPDNILPYNVNVISDGGKVSKKSMYTDSSNGGTVALESNAGGKTGISGAFESASGNVVFESYIFLPEDVNGAKVALTSAGNEVFSLKTEDGNFVAPDGSIVKYVTKNLWTIVRFEADTAASKVLVKINGKEVGTYDFTSPASFIDGYEISYTPSTESTMYTDEISAFIKLPYPDDYVPEPVIPESDYFIGLNVCSLWREGTHYGWEEITAYPELTPVLGYYDEGSPEVSDWEIKMMTEHGIDYQIFCWYPDGNSTEPIFRTRMNEALIDGYMNARYSDMMQFAIMWENSSTNGMSFEDFKNNLVPYWIEYFFKDPRYVKIDNKPLFTIWSLDNKFSGVSAKEALDYLRQECVKAGFDGCEILLYSSNTDASYKSTMDASGIDGLCAYHWGASGADVEKQLTSLTAYSALDYTIPTISVGFDYVGWGMSKQRNGLLDPADYPVLADAVKSALAERQAEGAKYSNMVLISTWNEYGEGTYVMPTERFGFGYLDAIRTAFTKDNTEHNDLTLTESQRQRINYLFDQNRQMLRPQLLETVEEEEQNDPYAEAVSVSKLTLDGLTVDSFSTYNSCKLEIKDGILCITPTSKDPAVFRNEYFDPVSAEEANCVKIRARVTGNAENVMQVFFRTNDGKDFSATKAARVPLVLNEWHDYYFDFRSNPEWTGSIVNLRIDPAEYQCDYAEIESVEFVKLPELVENVPFTVDIIGGQLTLTKPADTTDGHLMIPLYPEDGVFSRMKCTYSWDKNTKELTVTNGKHTVVMTIGTDDVVVDGVAQKFYAASYMYDGLPVVPFDSLVEALGYYVVYHEDGNGVSIMLNSPDDYDIINSRVPYKYEFNLEGDVEDWSAQNATFSVKNGTLVGVSSNSDPAAISPSLNVEAEKYPVIKVRMKWERDNVANNDYIGIYFKTSSTGLAESRKVSIPLDASSNGEFVEFTFNMADHLQWNGKITGIRVDPFNAPGTFEIDYIRFEMDEEAEIAQQYEQDRAENLDDTIANGDAEIKEYNPMTSDNATITIVERDDEGYCYDVQSKAGQNWTYCCQKVKFTPGTTYVIEFDARMTGLNDGDATEGLTTNIHANLMYSGGSGRDHFKSAGNLVMSADYEWTHYSVEITVGPECDNTNDVFGIYTNPINQKGVNYQLDNITITPKE